VHELNLYYNRLSGSIPDLSALTNLDWLHLGLNKLSGPIPDLSALTSLRGLDLFNNQLEGAIPDLSTLTSLIDIGLYDNQLTGSIPDLSALTNLEFLFLDDNQLSGSIPDLSSLTNLLILTLDNNQLSGRVPVSVCPLDFVDLRYNKLEVDTADLCVDIASPDWKDTQTVPPAYAAAEATTATDIKLTWNPIAYTQDGGYYGVWGKAPGNESYTLMVTTTNKSITNTVVSGLLPGTAYDFVIRTFTPAHDNQQNDLMSVDSAVTTATTKGYTLYLPIIITFVPLETKTINSILIPDEN
jgi:hypothetical protein